MRYTPTQIHLRDAEEERIWNAIYWHFTELGRDHTWSVDVANTIVEKTRRDTDGNT